MMVCFEDNYFPTINSLFGCDMALIEIPYGEDQFSMSSGFEIKRTKYETIPTEKEPCDL